MNILSETDLEDLAVGAALLGSGGGGNPAYDLLIAKELLSNGAKVELVSVDDLDETSFVAPVAFMGAPLVCTEKLPSGREFDLLLEKLERDSGRKVTHVAAAEIGGANAFTPIVAAAKRGVKVLDADTIGRAFPELQMSSCHLFGIRPCPAYLADAMGNVISLDLPSAGDLERFCRRITIEMGSSAALLAYPMDGLEAKETLIRGSVTRAMAIGREMRQASNPIERLVQKHEARIVCEGVIVDIDQQIRDGFLRGSFSVMEGSERVVVHYQNEYLLAEKDGVPLVSTPDILIPLERETGTPVTSESLQYGLRVVLAALPSPALWRTERGLSLVGPEVFGYRVDYASIKMGGVDG
jgi:DUF917 family protein